MIRASKTVISTHIKQEINITDDFVFGVEYWILCKYRQAYEENCKQKVNFRLVIGQGNVTVTVGTFHCRCHQPSIVFSESRIKTKGYFVCNHMLFKTPLPIGMRMTDMMLNWKDVPSLNNLNRICLFPVKCEIL